MTRKSQQDGVGRYLKLRDMEEVSLIGSARRAEVLPSSISQDFLQLEIARQTPRAQLISHSETNPKDSKCNYNEMSQAGSMKEMDLADPRRAPLSSGLASHWRKSGLGFAIQGTVMTAV